MSDSKSKVQGLIKVAKQPNKSRALAQIENEKQLSAEQAKSLFIVQDGLLVNLVMRGRRAMPGMSAGSTNGDGYLRVKVNNIAYRAHRVVWLITYGSWPAGQIDHINGVRDDNRIENLRDVTVQDNQRNQHIRTDNTSGVPGVHREDGVWKAKIKVDGKYISLGRFKEFDAAVLARKAAEVLYGFHPNHGATDHQRRAYSCINNQEAA